MAFDYIGWLANARREVERLRQERADIDRRITALTQNIHALASLEERNETADETIQTHRGMSDAIRQILEREKRPLYPMDISDLLERSGFDLSGYSSPLPNIHTTLKRMAAKGTSIKATRDPRGGTMYEFDPKAPAIRRYKTTRQKLREKK